MRISRGGAAAFAMVAALVVVLRMASAETAPSFVKQTSVPGALVPTNNNLLFHEPISDKGVCIELFRLQGEGVEWSPDGKSVAYDCKHKDGYYNIHLCGPDGTNDRCLTTLDNGLPHRHAGSPAWHPSGRYIAFAAEKKVHGGHSIEAIPGFGGRSDIWVMKADGSKAWPLTNLPDNRKDGVIIPKFSHDGKKLVWAQSYDNGKWFQPRQWEIQVGDFIETPDGPRLKNVRTFQPAGPAFYETYGFSADDRRIIFDSDFKHSGFFVTQIYTIDAETGADLKTLADNGCYNEHASYTPDGRHIIWMTSKDNKNHGTDWWIMRSDGSNKRRLTHFNQEGYPEGDRRPTYACLGHFAPNGKQFLGGIQYSLIKQEGRIMLVRLDPELLR
jgi:Tol biopolymer transport system component